jgi:C-terminal processing protease CtpA/Prc
VAKWFTPDGHAIDGTGLTPDVEILITEEDRAQGRDPQLERAISLLQNGT